MKDGKKALFLVRCGGAPLLPMPAGPENVSDGYGPFRALGAGSGTTPDTCRGPVSGKRRMRHRGMYRAFRHGQAYPGLSWGGRFSGKNDEEDGEALPGSAPRFPAAIRPVYGCL